MVFGLFLLLTPNNVYAANPGVISFQGKVVNSDGTNVTNGTYNFDFILYDDLTLGSPSDGVHDKWHELTKSVTVTNGVFQTYLGSATALPDFNANPTLYLAVRFNADAAGYMSPRVQMASVPYAINADKVGGVSVTSLGQLSSNQTWIGTQTLQPTTNITSAIVKQTSFATPTADIFGIQTANSTNILQITGPAANEAAVTLNSVGVTRALTLDSGSGTLVLGSNTTTLQKSGTAFTFDVTNAANSTLTITNSGAGVASLSVEGDINAGAGSKFKVGGTQISTTDLSDNTNIAKLSVGETFTGVITLQNSADSTSAFRLLTAGGTPRTILEVGTSNTEVSLDANLIVDSSVNLPSITSVSFSSNSTGSLSGAANTVYYYRISAIVGSETAASTETWIGSSSFTPISAPSAPSAAAGASGGITGTYLYKYTYLTANGETTASNASGGVTVSNKKITVTIATGPTGTTGRTIYRTTNGGTSYQLLTTINDNTTTTYTDSTLDSSLGVTAPTANTATTNLNSVSITFPSFPSATSYRIYRGTATLGEDHYLTATTSPFTDTGAIGTAATPIEPTSGRVGIKTSTPRYALDVNGNINASSAYIQGSNVGQTSSCGTGTTFSGFTVSGGIVTSVGACAAIGSGGSSATLQSAYDSSTVPQINLSSSGSTLTVRDTAGGLGTDLFDIQDNSGATTYFGVSATGISTSGTINSLGTISIGSTSVAGTLLLNDGSSNTVSLTASGVGASYSLTLPATAGGTSQCLKTDSVTASLLVFAACTTGGGGANTDLSNLASVAINTSLLPATTGSIDLGSSTKVFQNAYLNTIQAGTGNLIINASAGKNIVIGSATTDTSQVLLQVDSFSTFADTATCSTTTNQGAIYYNTATNVMRGCLNGNWEDLVSTAGLGLQLFGVVPDTGSNPGDLAAVSGAQNGPCKVSEGATTSTVSWTACTAYSGGRKVLVTAGTATTSSGSNPSNFYQHLCLTGTNGQPALSAIGTEVANLSTVSLPSVTSPILCLADIKTGNNSAVITGIFDTRTYTTTLKETVAIGTTAPAIGMLVQYIATKGVVQPMATANGNAIAGVVVATTGATSTTAINGIIAVSGPAAVKAVTGTNVVGAYIFGTTTAGYATTVAAKPAEATTTIYNLLGNARTAWTNTCAVNSDGCANSILTSIDKR